MQWATLAFLSASLVAVLDEWHQSYLKSRTGTLSDVLLDSGAALFAQIVLFAVLHLLKIETRRPLRGKIF
jgi:VanZ family protein